MRESIGGTMLMMIVFGFLAVYIGFMAVIINYARAYRTKNSMISYIERNEGVNGIDSAFPGLFAGSSKSEICSVDNGDTVYFRVKVPVRFDLPFSFGGIGGDGNGPVFWVSGETSVIKVPDGKNVVGSTLACTS